MPFKDPDPTDPNILVGVMLPADAEATRDMAYVFAEEFARLGYSREQLLWLFKNPFYGGAHGAYQALGESETLSIIDECLSAWGQVKFSILDLGFSIKGQKNETQDPPLFPIQNPKSKIQTRLASTSSETTLLLPQKSPTRYEPVGPKK
jgi:hypothetical protein